MRRFAITTTTTPVLASSTAALTSPAFVVPMPTNSFVRIRQAVALASDVGASGKLTLNALRATVNWLDIAGNTLRTVELPADVQWAGQTLPGGVTAVTVALPAHVEFDADDFITAPVVAISLVAVAIVTNTDGASSHNCAVTGKWLFETLSGDAP